jgi:parvulin-like peptidyl-prolyl isomerase
MLTSLLRGIPQRNIKHRIEIKQEIAMTNLLKTIIFCCVMGVSLSIFGSTLLGGEKKDDPVLAMVNGVPITKSQLAPLVDQYLDKSGKRAIGKEDKLQIIKGLITRQLILQQKESNDIRREERIVKQVKEFEDKLVIGAFLTKYVGKHLAVTDAEIKEYYQQNINKFASPPKVKPRHILLRNRKEAEQVKEKLRKGEDFAKLAKEYSIDLPMAIEGGGSMGIIEKGKTLPELEKVLFTLNVGEISDIVETRFGFHILTVDEIVTTQYRPLDEVSEIIKNTITVQKEEKAFNEMYGKLEKNAKIEIFEDRVQAAK